MHKFTLFVLAALFAVTLAEGQYYVPRAYYTIDAEGHESARVPLRRLRRSLRPYPYPSGGNNANANANAYSDGGSANANANAYSGGGWGSGGRGNGGWGSGGRSNGGWGSGGRSNGGWGIPAEGNGGWALPADGYGASKPTLSAGQTRRQYGPVEGHSVTASTSVGIDSSGYGYYDQSASVPY